MGPISRIRHIVPSLLYRKPIPCLLTSRNKFVINPLRSSVKPLLMTGFTSDIRYFSSGKSEMDQTRKYNAKLADAFASRNAPEMFAILEEMTENNIPFNSTTYNWMMTAFEANKQPTKCLNVLTDLERRDMATVSSYTIAVRALIEHGDIEKVLDVYARLKESGKAPDLMILNYILDCCAATANIPMALKMFEEFELYNIAPTADTFQAMLSTLTQGNDSNLSLDWFKKALVSLEALMSSKLKHLYGSYEKVYFQCYSQNNIDGMLYLLDVSKSNNLMGEYTMLLLALARLNPPNVEQLESTYKAFATEHKITKFATSVMLLTYIRIGDFEKVVHFCIENAHLCVITSGIIEQISSLICTNVETIDSAYFFLEKLKNEKHTIPIELLNTIVLSCSKLNDLDRAFGTVLEYSSFGVSPNTQTFECLLSAAEMNSDFIEAVLKEMRIHKIKKSEKIMKILTQN